MKGRKPSEETVVPFTGDGGNDERMRERGRQIAAELKPDYLSPGAAADYDRLRADPVQSDHQSPAGADARDVRPDVQGGRGMNSCDGSWRRRVPAGLCDTDPEQQAVQAATTRVQAAQ
ncbi:hypothetical protein [Pannonibacter sp. SL95]|uniref:hypothetical protein n=1 Tax=Pannonibacter sp. SL95 TaxID=2995153 RepID=UPI00227487EE|nr:hypothetical protein [Pannonibacter sp. SL95]MCY1709042.1 hypothetical protein [Pannonibacter sp. SL95]